MGPCCVLCLRLLCDLTISCTRLFQRVFLPLFVCQRSFSVSGQHGSARVDRSRDCNSFRASLWIADRLRASPACPTAIGQHDRYSAMAIAFERWPLRNPSVIAGLFDVAADRGISQSLLVIHGDVTKKS